MDDMLENATDGKMPISFVTSRHMVRPVNVSHKETIKRKFERYGFLDHPLLVTKDGCLWAGNHRYEVALELGISHVPMIIRTPQSLDRAALEDNEASKGALGNCFVDVAELVWRKLDSGMTQQAVGDELGMERGEVAKLAMLRKIDPKAWAMIVPVARSSGTNDAEGAGTQNVPDGTFSENLLRSILPLTADQQLDLVTRLASGAIQKSQFKTQAEKFRARNEAGAWIVRELVGVDQALIDEALAEIAKGVYDDEWVATDVAKKDGKATPSKTGGAPIKAGDAPEKLANSAGLKLSALAKSMIDRHNKLHAITLINGDFYVEIEKIKSGSINAVITDPPYNISQNRSYTRDDGSTIEKDFGDWDKVDKSEFLEMIDKWSVEFFRIMIPGASGFIFVGEDYIQSIKDAFKATGFDIRATFYWCRTNPGASMQQTDFMPAMDFAIQFSKPGAPRTFNYPGDAAGVGFNWRAFPICSGDERIKKPNGAQAKGESNTLHPTQKPEAVIRHLMDAITVSGDTVFDGFSGVGTTAAVAKKSGRRFIGFELDPVYFTAAKVRIA